MASNRIFDKMHIEWRDVAAARSCKQNCVGCRVYVYIDQSKIKYKQHLQYLEDSCINDHILFPLILFDGSNMCQIKKARKAVRMGFGAARKEFEDSCKSYAAFKHKKARKKRNIKLNKSLGSK